MWVGAWRAGSNRRLGSNGGAAKSRSGTSLDVPSHAVSRTATERAATVRFGERKRRLSRPMSLLAVLSPVPAR